MATTSLRTLLLSTALALAAPLSAQAVTPDEAKAVAMDAYIYGYSLLTTEVTRVQMSNVAVASDTLTAPMGQFANVPKYPPANYRGVSAPNADTLYSVAWLDLSEPQVFTHPDMGNRFYLFPMTDLWMTDFASKGTRTAGSGAGTYLITGPGWKGTVPAGMQQVPVATQYMVILGRTYADGTDTDYKAANALQAQYKITPLSAWGTDYKPVAPPVDPNPGFSMTDAPQKVILDMGVQGYFQKLADLMCKAAPPAAEDKPILDRMATMGIVPCKPFDLAALGPDVGTALKTLPQDALDNMGKNHASMGKMVKGWVITVGLGVYGTDYMKRAVVAAFGWPANVQEDAVYPYTEVDSTGATLSGANKYTLTFPKGQTPPAQGFWSITMYQIDQGWWFVPNPLNKFTVSPRNNLKPNADGSITLYFQNQSPGADLESNWLPAPTGNFLPMLRMYWPQEKNPSIIDGTWTPPAVVKVN